MFAYEKAPPSLDELFDVIEIVKNVQSFFSFSVLSDQQKYSVYKHKRPKSRKSSQMLVVVDVW